MTSTSADMLEAAKFYTSAGLVVHPLRSPTDVTAGKSAGKAPVLPNYNSLTESAPMQKFTGSRNIGVVCGANSDLTVIDIDYYFRGLWDYIFENCDTRRFVKQFHTEERWHWLFRYCETLPAKQYQELGFDILTNGSNCVMSPSVHKDGSQYQIEGDIKSRPEFPMNAAARLFEVLQTYEEFKSILSKCRSAWRDLWKAVFIKKGDELYRDPWTAFRGEEGRKRHLGFCSELLANGAEEKHLVFTAWLIFPESYNEAETRKNLKGINPKATWKNETIKADDVLNRFFARGGGTKKFGDTLKGLLPTPGTIAQALQDATPIYYDNSRNFWMWDEEAHKYNRVDDTEIMCRISEALELSVYNSKMKAEILEALRQTGRMRRVKPVKRSWIQFSNLVYDLDSDETFKATPEYFFVSPIPHKIGDSEETPTIDSLFKSWLEDRPELLYEICAYCLYAGYPIQRIFAFIGSGSNGKGQFMKVLRTLLGDDNCTSTDLDRLAQSRFEAAKLYNKKAAFVSETNYNSLTSTNTLKQLCGGDLISAEFKGKDPFDFENTAKIVIATNGLPTTSDRSDGFYRRWCLIEFKNKFLDGKDVVDEIPETEFENLCLKCVRILKNILSLGKLPHEDDRERRKDKYEALSNPVQAFIDDECELDCDAVVPLWYLFKKFDEYRTVKGQRKFTDREFKKALRDMGFEIKQKWYNQKEAAAFKDVSSTSDGQNWRAVYGLGLVSSSSSSSSEASTQTPHKAPLVTPTARTARTARIEENPSFTEKSRNNASVDLGDPKDKEVQSCVMTPEEAAALAIKGGL